MFGVFRKEKRGIRQEIDSPYQWGMYTKSKNGSSKKEECFAMGIRKRDRRREGVARKQRIMAGIRKDYLEGTYHAQHDLATKYGISDTSVSVYLLQIKEIIDEDFKEETVADKNRRIKQLEDVQAKANLAWERSKQNSEELRIQYVKVKCRDCKGTGMQEDGQTRCETCEGSGRVTDEVVSRRVTGQAGEPRFLSLVNECVKEISRLNGHYPEKGRKKDESEGDKHLHLHLGEGGKVDPDILIQMRRLMIQAEESRNGNGQVLEESTVDEEKKGEQK